VCPISPRCCAGRQGRFKSFAAHIFSGRYPFGAFAALASVPISAVFMSRTGVMFREIGAQPPSMFAVRNAMIFALGIAVTRTLMAG
jgi:hypothetical protein